MTNSKAHTVQSLADAHNCTPLDVVMIVADYTIDFDIPIDEARAAIVTTYGPISDSLLEDLMQEFSEEPNETKIDEL